MSQHMVLHARCSLTRQPLFNTFTVVRNICICPIQKYNSKNCRAQMISGTSAASIVNFVVDIWMLKMENAAKQLYRIQDWASNAAVLRLASSKIVSKLLGCKFNDVGNCSSLIFSLDFIRLWSLSINARQLRWQYRCVYQ